MIALIWNELASRKFMLIICSLLALGFATMYVGIFPTIQAQSRQLMQVTESFSSTFKALGVTELGFSNVEAFLSLEYFSLIWPLLLLILVSSWTSGTIAGDIEQGTMGLLLALPVSRGALYWSKYVAAWMGMVVFVMVSVLAIIPIVFAFGLSYDMDHLLKAAALCLLFSWAFLSLGMLLSSILREKGKVGLGMSGIGLLMYVLMAVSGLIDKVSWLKYGSFFSYLNIQQVLVHGQWQWLSVSVFAAVIALSSVAGAVWFNQRDMSV
jgi:ABC-2 type transport system permease protein